MTKKKYLLLSVIACPIGAFLLIAAVDRLRDSADRMK
jgi:hypothetical protein